MDKTEGTGERVGGYRVVRKLATGGTSNVLLAKAEGPHGFERSVVLKLLLPEYKHDAEFKGMFAREAAAYARLSHPSIVRLYDFFATDDELVMVLEYIDGPPLSRLRGMLKTVGQQFDDTTAIYIAASIFDALAAAHGALDDAGEPAPVIHRDVNPSNVLIPWDGHVKLADFGVAKVTGASHQSSVGLIRGTFGYMAPEQVKGETVTPRADVYAGAIILWEMLTKRRAFIRGALPEIEVLRELAEPRIVSIDTIRPDVDERVRDAIKRALQPRGDKRTITAEEMASILRAVVPESEGREKLAKALAFVRHEPRPSATSIPPPVTTASPEPGGTRPVPRAPMLTKPGLAPRVTPPPRPAVNVSRKTAPYGAQARPPAPPVGGIAPRPPSVPPRPTPKRSEPPPPTDPAPSSERGLAALLEPSESDPLPNPSGAEGAPRVPVFDSLVEPPELVRATGRESERMRLATPLAGIAPGRDLKEAIDEILRDIPSNVPPNLFPKTDPPGGVPSGPVGGDDVLADPFARQVGQLPAAPLPLDPAVPLDLGATFADEPVAKAPSSFPPLDRTLAIERAPARPAPKRPAPHAALNTTVPMHAAPPLASPPTTRMAPVAPSAVVAPPLQPPPPAAHVAASVGPPPYVQSQPSIPVPGSYPPPHVPASAGTGSVPSASGPYAPLSPPSVPPSVAPPGRRSSALAITGVLLAAVLAGGVGTVFYVRRQKAHPVAVVPTPSTPPPPTSAVIAPFVSAPVASANTLATPATASGSASPSPGASASASPSASASSSAPASASASASAAPGAADVPAGMGRLRTTGAAPGRRIFVDEKTVGQTPESVVVKCGVRSVKLGSSGVARPIEIPCGGEITVGDR